MVLRGGARAFDLALTLALARFGGGAGLVLALLFTLLADGFSSGQSPGKRLFGVRVLHVPTRSPGRYRDSVLRNAPFGLVLLLGMMPEPLGPGAFLGGALAVGSLELRAALKSSEGLRMGDHWAETQVVDGKEPAADVPRPVGPSVRMSVPTAPTQSRDTSPQPTAPYREMYP